MGKGLDGKAMFMFMGINLHSYYWMLCPAETRYSLLMRFFEKMALDIVPIFMELFDITLYLQYEFWQILFQYSSKMVLRVSSPFNSVLAFVTFLDLKVTATPSLSALTQQTVGLNQRDSFSWNFCWIAGVDQGSSPYIQMDIMLYYPIVWFLGALYPQYSCNIFPQFAVTIS